VCAESLGLVLLSDEGVVYLNCCSM